MSTPTITTLTAEKAIAQVREWIIAGLPEGHIDGYTEHISLMVGSIAEVDLWMSAMGLTAEAIGRTYGATPNPRPLLLHGWPLDVWCYGVPLVDPGVRIEVA